MVTWWEMLTLTEKFFAIFAIPATIILVLQTILLLFGMGSHSDSDSDHDFDHDDISHESDHDHDYHDAGLRIFTVRTFIAFFSIFGWTGIVLSKSGAIDAVSITIASLAGLVAMFTTAYIIKAMLKLQTSGNVQPENAIGKSANVYLTIPAKRGGRGKVTILLQGRYTEMDAVTDSDSSLATGSEVVVVSASSQNVLTVVPKI